MDETGVSSVFRAVMASLLGLIVAGLGVGLLEAGAYLGLSWLDRDLLRAVRERHVLLGERGTSRILIPLSPLYGWGGWSERPPGALRRRRGEHGFLIGKNDGPTALDPTADVRIFVVGGSTVVGYPQPMDESIPAFLERFLERRHDLNFNVINAGMGGWYSANELAIVLQKILPFFTPDAVVVLDGANDVWPAVTAAAERDGTVLQPAPETGFLLDHHRLWKNLLQHRSLHGDPGFVLNQLLQVLGIRRYFQPGRYFLTSGLVDLFGHRRSGASSRRWERVKKAWGEYELPWAYRKRFQRRLSENPPLERWWKRRLMSKLEPWAETQLRYEVGRLPPAAWDRRRGYLERLRRSKKLRQEFVERVSGGYRLPPDRLEALPCRGVPITARPYLHRVRTLVGSVLQQNAAVVHALQPALAFKTHKMIGEKHAFDIARTRHFLESLSRWNLPPGRCWGRIQREFFRRAGSKLRDLRAFDPRHGRVLDLSRLFARDRTKRFADPVHYTPAGHREIARVLAEELEGMAVW